MESKPDKSDMEKLSWWKDLKRFTAARIQIGRVGGSLPTKEWLKFKYEHSRAKDAVGTVVQLNELTTNLAKISITSTELYSQASDLQSFLARPDLGRKLHLSSVTELQKHRQNTGKQDIAILVSGGLSGRAVEVGAESLLICLKRKFDLEGLPLNHVFTCTRGRVALGDPVGEILGARLSIVIVGERPGLGHADSLGAYLTYMPKSGRTDSERNCVSNIRQHGLSFAAAAHRLCWLVKEALRLQLTGVGLKDSSENIPVAELK